MPPDSLPAPETRPYTPYGAAIDVLRAREPEVLLSGPAGTGKTRANLEKLYAVAGKYPGCRLLIVRKTRASLTQSILVTWESKVVPRAHPCLRGPTRAHRQEYRFPNGAVVAVAGLDEPTRVMSTEWDIIYVAEAIELSENDWESLTTRLRNGALPYQQMIADTNPDGPRHWLYQRAQGGRVRMLESRHEHNPAVFDQRTGEPTTAGGAYLAVLDALTGVRHARLRLGRWVQAEGVVYDGYDPALHLIARAELPAGWETWERLWAVDFGFTNPFVWQEWARDDDGRLYRLREIYHTGRLVEDHAAAIKKLTASDPRPTVVVCDHDAEDRKTLERHTGMPTRGAYKSVSPGIQAVAARLKPAGDGKPRLFFVRDALAERDETLAERKAPGCTEEEFDTYIWDTGGGKKRGEEPVKLHDHGCFVAGTMVATVGGNVAIEQIRPGDFVLTRDGARRVLAAGCTNRDATVYECLFSDGRAIVGTGNHPVWVEGKGFVPIDTMRYNDTVCTLNHYLLKTPTLSEFDSTGLCIAATLPLKTSVIRTTTDAGMVINRVDIRHCTVIFTNTTMAKSRRVGRFITKTATRQIMMLKTLKPCLRLSITNGTCLIVASDRLSLTKPLPATVRRCKKRRRSGINQSKGDCGISKTASAVLKIGSMSSGTAKCADRRTVQKRLTQTVRVSARINASRLSVGRQVSIMSNGCATAENNSSLASILPPIIVADGARRNFDVSPNRAIAFAVEPGSTCAPLKKSNTARLTVHTVSVKSLQQPVYNLTVEGTPEYFANGVLVHNCDAARYMVAYCDNISVAAQVRFRPY